MSLHASMNPTGTREERMLRIRSVINETRVPSVAWFALALLLGSLWLWSQRYEYQPCSDGGVCVRVDRWTGEASYFLTPAAKNGIDQKYGADAVGELLNHLNGETP